MTDAAPDANRRSIEQGTHPDVETALYDAFHAPFQLWPVDACLEHRWGTRHRDTKDPPWPAANSDQALPLDAELLQRTARADSVPELVALADGEHLLVLPIRSSDVTESIATAVIRTSEPSMLLSLATQFQQQSNLHCQVNRLRWERDSLMRQILADFDELSFLRQMAEHLSMAEVSLDTMEMAGKVLPGLRERIHAEAVIFVAAGRDKSACLVGRPVLTEGRIQLEDRHCTRLVERFRDAAMLQPVVRNNCARHEDFAGMEGIESFILAPLVRCKSVLGWLLALNRSPAVRLDRTTPDCRLNRHEFGVNEATLMRSTAAILATHATNVELLRDKDQLLFDMVRALVNAVEAKDRYTAGHSERVALYARQLGSAMGLKAKICQRVYLAGLLHDLGKIAVSDELLSNVNRLSDEEFTEIKTHPDEGWGILYGLEALDDVLVGVLHHHERWDGKGYPDGLSGEEIPLDVRILAIADAFDAITSDRPYRQARPVAKAEAILRAGAGTQWDPVAVGIFLGVLPEIERIRDIYESASSSHAADIVCSSDALPKNRRASRTRPRPCSRSVCAEQKRKIEDQ